MLFTALQTHLHLIPTIYPSAPATCLDQQLFNLILPYQLCRGDRNARSLLTLTAKICEFNSLASLVVTLAAMTGLETPQARPNAVLEGKKTYGTFLSSHRRGRWRTISIGSTSAVMTMNSQIPRLSVLVASLALYAEAERSEDGDIAERDKTGISRRK